MTAGQSLAIRHAVTVACDPAHAFDVFTSRIDTWWPLGTHSVAAMLLELEPVSVRFDPGPDGAIVELLPDGTETSWARVRAWDPPRRLLLGWQPNPHATSETEIEVTFSAVEGGTRVVLEHRGFESLERRTEYDGGWPLVLEALAAAV